MNRLLRVAALAALALMLGSASSRFEPAAAPDFDHRLRQALDEGRIDEAHATLYRLFAIKAPGRLPDEFRSDLVPGESAAKRTAEGVPESIHRCGTSDLRAVQTGLEAMPADLRAEAEALLHPPVTRTALYRTAAGKTVAHALANWVTTANFSIEWGPNLTNEDGSIPVRDTNANGIPDVIEHWAAYLEASYQEEVVNRGFGSVAGAGALATSLIPVYIGNTDPTQTGLAGIDPTTYAYTQSDSPTAYLVVNKDLSFTPGNQDPDGRILGAMKVTAAHEFFHVIQFLIMPADLPAGIWNYVKDDWWLEASSTWMEDEVFDQVNDYWQYYGPAGSGLWDDYVATGLPEDYGSIHYNDKVYGNAIFGKYLSEHVGGHASFESVWKDFIVPGSAGTRVTSGRRPIDALEAFSSAKGFSGLGGLFQGYTAANATMDYREGAHYGAVPVLSRSTLTASTATGLPSLSYLGAAYLLRTGTQNGSGLTANLTGFSTVPWGLSLSLTRGTAYTLVLGATNNGGTLQVAVSTVGASDTLYGVPSYLNNSAAVTGYSTLEGTGPANLGAPVAATGLSASPAPGGLDLSWATATGAVGYVVQWRRQGTLTYSARTVFGPVTRIELRGLTGSVPYESRVFAYGATGNEGPTSSFATTTTGAASLTPTPTPAMTLSSGSGGGSGGGSSGGSSGGGGGGGGGGCFLHALAL